MISWLKFCLDLIREVNKELKLDRDLEICSSVACNEVVPNTTSTITYIEYKDKAQVIWNKKIERLSVRAPVATNEKIPEFCWRNNDPKSIGTNKSGYPIGNKGGFDAIWMKIVITLKPFNVIPFSFERVFDVEQSNYYCDNVEWSC